MIQRFRIRFSRRSTQASVGPAKDREDKGEQYTRRGILRTPGVEPDSATLIAVPILAVQSGTDAPRHVPLTSGLRRTARHSRSAGSCTSAERDAHPPLTEPSPATHRRPRPHSGSRLRRRETHDTPMTTSHNTLVAAFRRGDHIRAEHAPAHRTRQDGSTISAAPSSSRRSRTPALSTILEPSEAILLSTAAPAIRAPCGAGSGRLWNLAPGSSAKTPILLYKKKKRSAPSAYVPMEFPGTSMRPVGPAESIAGFHACRSTSLRGTSQALRPTLRGGRLSPPRIFPELDHRQFSRAPGGGSPESFPGRTLGNGAMLLIEDIDRIKDRAHSPRAAYDDAEGVTARFNLNLLHRMDRELGASIPIEAFRHRVLWNRPSRRIEMHLESSAGESLIRSRARAFTMAAE